jgi:hypothetical protein
MDSIRITRRASEESVHKNGDFLNKKTKKLKPDDGHVHPAIGTMLRPKSGEGSIGKKAHTMSFIPPSARRKSEYREIQRRAQARMNRLLLFVLIVSLAAFVVVLNMRYIRRMKPAANPSTNYIPRNPSHSTVDHPVKLRGGRTWISEESQPFVRTRTTDRVIAFLWRLFFVVQAELLL